MARLRILSIDPETIVRELGGKIATAPKFFQSAAVCLDLGGLETPPDAAALRGVIEAVRRTGMMPVGLIDAGIHTATLALDAGLPLLTPFRPTRKSAPSAPESATAAQTPPATPVLASTPAPASTSASTTASAAATAATSAPAHASTSASTSAPVPTSASTSARTAPAPQTASPAPAQEFQSPGALIHGKPVRSGQRVYARRTDLIVNATVNAGAEVMADGCVHVYGQLRGRVMAGTRGDTAARVFCLHFNPELVSIAGVFRVFETVPAELAGQAVQVWLDGDSLRFARISD
jgi:septum site-determining protein MinC